MSILRPTAYGFWASGPSGNVVEPIDADKAQGFLPTGIARSAYANWLWGVAGAWHQYLDAYRGIGNFGAGIDGIATLAGATAYARDMHYLRLTITPSGVAAAGNASGVFRVYAQDFLANNGVIHADGLTASGQSGAYATVGSIGSGQHGGAGSSGAASVAGTNVIDSLGGNGGTGGTALVFGAAGGTSLALPPTYGSAYSPVVASQGYVMGQAAGVAGVKYVAGGAGGGGGGAGVGAGASSYPGGGGGAGGGVLLVSARSIINNGRMSANGGAGATGLGATGSIVSGGGGGGGGGIVYLNYMQYSGTGTLEVKGGAGGKDSSANGFTGFPGTIVHNFPTGLFG